MPGYAQWRRQSIIQDLRPHTHQWTHESHPCVTIALQQAGSVLQAVQLRGGVASIKRMRQGHVRLNPAQAMILQIGRTKERGCSRQREDRGACVVCEGWEGENLRAQRSACSGGRFQYRDVNAGASQGNRSDKAIWPTAHYDRIPGSRHSNIITLAVLTMLIAPEHTPFLSFRNVSVMRGESVILHNINLDLKRGERVAILGPNGCGKSTLIKAMTSEIYPLVKPGMHVEIFGRQRWDLQQLKQKLGVVTSETPGKSARHTTAFDAVLTGFFSSATLWPNLVVTEDMCLKAAEAMRHVGAESYAQQKLGTLSAGQQKRVMIARALVGSGNAPAERMLLLDEPSNALDIAAQAELRRKMRELVQQGTGLILVTHQIADIIPEIDRVLTMKDGRIVGDGTRDQMITEERLHDLFGVRVTVTERDGYLHAW